MKNVMKANVLSVLALGVLLSVNTYAQVSPSPSDTSAAAREARKEIRKQKVENSKGELKEIGQDVEKGAKKAARKTKEEAKEVGVAARKGAAKAGDAIDRKVEARNERKARRAAKRDTTL
jgi:biopolymer transport protein ExbB/TolQ